MFDLLHNPFRPQLDLGPGLVEDTPIRDTLAQQYHGVGWLNVCGSYQRWLP
jgi:hypothetical protein